MKIRVLILLASCLLFQSFAQREPNSYSLEKAFNVRMPISRSSRQVVSLKFDGKTPKLEVNIGSKKQSLSFDSFTPEEQPLSRVLVDDFNFDGFIDIGIPTGIGYGGVNYFYDFFTFERSSRTFKNMDTPDPNTGGWCNPQLETKTKTIFTSCKSGPKWYGENFRFYRAKPYLYQSGEMVILNGFPDDKNLSNLIWHETTFNHNKRIIRSRFYDYGTTKAPIRRIVQAKVFLYTAPTDNAITKNYIIKNDLISILEVMDTDNGQWLKIAFQSQKFGQITRWIRLENE